MDDKERTQKIFDKFMDILEKENPDLYSRVLDQNFLFLPIDGGYSVLKALKNVTSEEQKYLDQLLAFAGKEVQ